MLFFKARLAINAARSGRIGAQALDIDRAATIGTDAKTAVGEALQRGIEIVQCIGMPL